MSSFHIRAPVESFSAILSLFSKLKLPNSRSPQDKMLIKKILRRSIFGVLVGPSVICLYALTRDVKITRQCSRDGQTIKLRQGSG